MWLLYHGAATQSAEQLLSLSCNGYPAKHSEAHLNLYDKESMVWAASILYLLVSILVAGCLLGSLYQLGGLHICTE